MSRLHAELAYVIAQWKANLAAAREYRAAVVSLIVGMFIAQALAVMALAAIVITMVSGGLFYGGLRKYESGSALNVNV